MARALSQFVGRLGQPFFASIHAADSRSSRPLQARHRPVRSWDRSESHARIRQWHCRCSPASHIPEDSPGRGCRLRRQQAAYPGWTFNLRRSSGVDLCRQHVQRCADHFVLQAEGVGYLSFNALGSELPMGSRVHKVAVDPERLSRPLETTFQNQVGAKFSPRILGRLHPLVPEVPW